MRAAAAMRFGLSGTHGGLEGPGPTPTIELAKLAERLGFDSLWFNEEHFERAGVTRARPILSPVVLAAAVAAATTTLRVGFSVLLVPLHHPLRLAEEIATLDVLSEGRVNFGISRANGTRYAGPFGYDREAGPSLEECVGTIIGYWTGTPVLSDGTERQVTPQPAQRPHPPVYVGGYSEETIAWTAEQGYSTIQHGIQSRTSLDRCLRSFAAHGGDLARVPVGRFCYVGESDAAARRDVWDVVCQQAGFLRQIGIWRGGDRVINETDLDPERFYHETAIVGGPETVAAKIAELAAEYGVRHINLLSSFFGFLPESFLRRSLDLFGKEVAPRFTEGAAAPP